MSRKTLTQSHMRRKKANKPKGPSHLPPECKCSRSPAHLATSQGSRMPSLLLRKEKLKA